MNLSNQQGFDRAPDNSNSVDFVWPQLVELLRHDPVGSCFLRLDPKSQSQLWYLVVERIKAEEVAVILGVLPEAVPVLFQKIILDFRQRLISEDEKFLGIGADLLELQIFISSSLKQALIRL